ncbi:two-component system sensor histidine kinase NtrB [Megalodesulfovibrio gigas]|uniref:histidine kinase n=1 Tax=Megalodesulfovibrio gigas (strain ATCC 19364 / DSM 1382 / NCIMB 9332 / VKM B-1759) TaxID=1121448 RepID=T2GCT4_MEGG1|nr:ATP-binding protein [Megalodesulfovibrio gigas]AGW13717.1 putative sensory box histidine kinase [Megalodesulfovibrio gigas DSM 1382 = ATCC 19364]
MQFLPAKNKGPLLLALATLLLIALALAASSLQALREQRRSLDSHLLLAARSVHAALAGALRRRPLQDGELPLIPGAAAFMQELRAESGVHFLGVYGPEGERLVAPLFDEDAQRFQISKRMVQVMQEEGEFKGVELAGGLQLFVYGRDMGPPRLRDRLGLPGLPVPPSAGPFERPGPDRPPPRQPPLQARRVLLVGLDMSPHLATYRSFVRTALLQTSLVFFAAAGLWVLGVVLLNRRELARKTVTLERLQSRLLDNLPDGLVHLDGHGAVLAANPAAHVLLGVEEGALVGRNSLTLGSQAAALLADESDAVAHRPVRWRQQQHGERFLEVLSLTMDEAGPAGAHGHPCAVTASPGCGERLVLLRDRTELKKLEEHLSDARRLATVGVLAAGVAHEIRNPLSALRGFAQFFAKKLAGKQPEEQYANTMVSEADRLNRVVGDLLNLARPRALSPAMVDLQALGEELGHLLEQDIAAVDAVFSTDFQAQMCYADADAIKQCLLNLILNSLQALGEGREAAAPAAHPAVRLGAVSVFGTSGTAGGVEVFVQDNGPGMRESERRHAFDPFYTSKPRGAGLGLALVEKTMREHGGSARIESAPGQGTTVRLLFPFPSGEEAA